MAVAQVVKQTITLEVGAEPLVILPLREYQQLRVKAAPVYFLKGKPAAELDALVRDGRRDHALGKTRLIESLGDLD